MREYNWVVLGTGVIANELATAFSKHNKSLYGVVNRTYEKAVDFASKYGVKKIYRTFDEVLSDENVDIVYITTPHNTHIEYMKKAIYAKKNILCEKSITLNIDELDTAISLAKEKGVVLMEAMTIFHMPLYKKLKEIVNSKSLGNVNIITMNFGSFKEYDMNNRFFNRNLAGGAILDIGVYALSLIRLFMESKPDIIEGNVKKAPTGVDENVTAILKNKQEQMATMALSLHSKQPKRAMISCTEGYIEIMEYPRGMEATITYTNSGKQEIISYGETADALWYEAEDMEKALEGQDTTKIEYTRDVMEMMTLLREKFGVVYPEEE